MSWLELCPYRQRPPSQDQSSYLITEHDIDSIYDDVCSFISMHNNHSHIYYDQWNSRVHVMILLLNKNYVEPKRIYDSKGARLDSL
jgi:hypothetical protein